MQQVIVILFVVVLSLDYLRIEDYVPRSAMLIPDMLSVVAFLLVLGRLAIGKTLKAGPKYMVVGILLVVHIVAGLAINQSDPGETIGGLRIYFKYLPFFLAPLVYAYEAKHFKFNVGVIVAFLALQLPINLYQRFIQYSNLATGDVVRGTFGTGSLQSVVLIAAISVVISCYLKKLISLPKAAALFLLFVVPTTLTETKGTLILLPLAILGPFISYNQEGRRISKALTASALLGIVMIGFVFAYNTTQTSVGGRVQSLQDFFLNPQSLLHYIAPRTAGMEHVDTRYGRVDKVVAPLQDLSKDPVKLLSGLGMGALNNTPLSLFRAEDHAEIKEEGKAGISLSLLLWEVGVLGICLIFLMLAMLVLDGRKVSRMGNDLRHAFALAWCGVVPIFVVSMIWKNIIVVDPIMYLFAYFSGHVVAARFANRGPIPNILKPATFEGASRDAWERPSLGSPYLRQF